MYQTVTAATYLPDQQPTGEIVGLPNGDSFYFVNTVTLGETLVASSVFLLLAFLVLKWFLEKVWGRS